MLNMSNNAWLVLEQLTAGGVWDGALVSKAGRTELIRNGFARRVERANGDCVNELTRKGMELAIRFVPEGTVRH